MSIGNNFHLNGNELTSGRPKLAIMTSGGDCAGLNAAIQSVVEEGTKTGWDVIGIEDGALGLYHNKTRPLCPERVKGWEDLPSTKLYSTREKFIGFDPSDRMIANFRALDAKALIVIGGDGSLSKMWELAKKGKIPLVAIPKTIDHDIGCTDMSIGFDSAVKTVITAMDNLRETSRSHKRITVVETMGRDHGWIALTAAIEGKADAVITPEIVIDKKTPYDLTRIAEHLRQRVESQIDGEEKRYAFLVVSEGVQAPQGGQVFRPHGKGKSLGGISHVLTGLIEDITGLETRAFELAHTQRGAIPSPIDRQLGANMGLFAMDAVNQGKFGVMTAIKGQHSYSPEGYHYVPIERAISEKHIMRPNDPLVRDAINQGIYFNEELSPSGGRNSALDVNKRRPAFSIATL